MGYSRRPPPAYRPRRPLDLRAVRPAPLIPGTVLALSVLLAAVLLLAALR